MFENVGGDLVSHECVHCFLFFPARLHVANVPICVISDHCSCAANEEKEDLLKI